MISKKKVTALALAGLFVTPVLADTYVPNNNSIQSGDGYLTADDDLFSQALKNSRLQQGRRQTLDVGQAQRKE